MVLRVCQHLHLLSLLILLQASVFIVFRHSGFMTELMKAHTQTFHEKELLLRQAPRSTFPSTVLLAGHAAAAKRTIMDDSATKQQESDNNEWSSKIDEERVPKPWQTASHPNCNDMHSLSMGDLLVEGSQHPPNGLFEIFQSGGSRITGKLGMHHKKVVIYIMSRFKKDLDKERYERSRCEAVAMGMLQGSSPDIHGLCVMSSLTKYGDGGM